MSAGFELIPQILVHPPIPDPLHSVAPRVIMGQSLWDTTRKRVYEQQEFKCVACGVHRDDAKFRQWLECHEFYNIDYDEKTMTLEFFVGLCHACHNFIHSNRLNILFKKKQIDSGKYYTILHHGKRILEEHGLVDQYKDNREFANSRPYDEEWSEWRMIWNGYAYRSALRSREEWWEHYNVEQKKNIKPIIERL